MENSRIALSEPLSPACISEMADHAAAHISGLVVETPIVVSESLGGVYVKEETRQPTRAFKVRGAASAVIESASQGVEAVTAASTGNHGRAVALAAQRLGLSSIIVVPSTTSEAKKAAIRLEGGDLVEYRGNLQEAIDYAKSRADGQRVKFVHPYADQHVIAGQATMGLEMLRQVPDMTHLVLPVGGGGLAAGVASVIAERSASKVEVVAAQVESCDAFVRSLLSGRLVDLDTVDNRYEGLAVAQTNQVTFGIVRPLVDSTIVMAHTDVLTTIHDYRQETGVLLEPAAGVALAAARRLQERLKSSSAKVVVPATGANPPAAFGPWLSAHVRSVEQQREFLAQRRQAMLKYQ